MDHDMVRFCSIAGGVWVVAKVGDDRLKRLRGHGGALAGMTEKEIGAALLSIAGVTVTRGKAAGKRRFEDLKAFYRARSEDPRFAPPPPDLAEPVRVFVREIGDWPKVWRIADGNPPSYVLKARYASPAGLTQSRYAALGLGLVVSAVAMAWGSHQADFQASVVFYYGMAAAAGVVAWKLAEPLLAGLTPFLFTPELEITIRRGALEWVGMRRSWTGQRITEKVFGGEPFSLRVKQHRDAPAAIRKVQEAVRRGRPEPENFYVRASELVADIAGKATSLCIAEIAEDEDGALARRLGIALDAMGMAGRGEREDDSVLDEPREWT